MIEELIQSLSEHIGEARWIDDEPIVIFDWRKEQESALEWLDEYGFWMKDAETSENPVLQIAVDANEGKWITDKLFPIACIGEHYGDLEEEFPFVAQVDEIWFLKLDESDKGAEIVSWPTDAPNHDLITEFPASELKNMKFTDENPFE